MMFFDEKVNLIVNIHNDYTINNQAVQWLFCLIYSIKLECNRDLCQMSGKSIDY